MNAVRKGELCVVRRLERQGRGALLVSELRILTSGSMQPGVLDQEGLAGV
jgi:hypothetical protein